MDSVAKKNTDKCKKSGRNPFAFFSGEDDIGSSDCATSSEEEAEEEPKTEHAEQMKLNFISKPNTENDKSDKKLPPPDKLFEEISTPDFVKKKLSDNAWERFVKSDISEADHPVVDLSGSTNAMPPPASYDIQTESIKPTLGETEQAAQEDSSRKRSNDGEDDYESSKKLKE